MSRTLQAVLDTIPGVAYVGGHSVVALPPSSVDAIWDEMRVAVDGTIVLRPFDPGEDIVTGAPIVMLTEGSDSLVTEAGDRIISEVAA